MYRTISVDSRSDSACPTQIQWKDTAEDLIGAKQVNLHCSIHSSNMSSLVAGAKRRLDDISGPTERIDNSVMSIDIISPTPRITQVTDSVGQNDSTIIHTPNHYSQQHGTKRPFSHGSQALVGPLCEPTSGPPTPPLLEPSSPISRVFSQDSSIVLIGIRGSGKSTLAVILSTATGRRLVEADQYFQKATGLSRHAFKKKHDTGEYQSNEIKVMSLMLEEHKKGSVIVCGPGFMGKGVQRLLKDYARTNPVIHILRDAASIQRHLGGWTIEQINHFLALSGPLYRACSNLEFFNVLESKPDNVQEIQGTSANSGIHRRPHTCSPYLGLKKVQRNFLGFIAFVTRNIATLRTIHAPLPLLLLAIESRLYTYAATVSLSTLLDNNLDIEDLASTADAFELNVDVADLWAVNLKLDSAFEDKISQAVATIRRNAIVPMIYHVPFQSHLNTLQSEAVSSYLSLVMLGLRLAPEFLTLDLSHNDFILSPLIASKGPTRIIGHLSLNSGSWDDNECMAIYKRAMRLGCDIVRISRPALTMEDNFAVQRFRYRISCLPEPHPPIIAFNSGLLGRLSSWSNPILTPVSHPSLYQYNLNGCDPCITVHEAQTALFASFTLDPLKFYIFGGNVMNSLSPAMHTAAYKACGMPHEYTRYQTTELRSLADLVQDPNFGGSSVNLPFKTEVITLLHSLSPHARAIGAVNTLLPIRTLLDDDTMPQNLKMHLERNRAGPVKGLYGDNTDWIGIFECIRRGLSPANAVSPSSTGLVIGAGGMARAAIYSMIHLGVTNIFIHNRTLANAERLAQHYNRQFSNGKDVGVGIREATVHVIPSLEDPWPRDHKGPTMVISCIPAHGLGGKPAPNFEMPPCWLSSPTGGVVVEVR